MSFVWCVYLWDRHDGIKFPQIQIVGLNTANPHLGYEASRTRGLRINFDPLGTFKVRPNLSTRELSLFAPIQIHCGCN